MGADRMTLDFCRHTYSRPCAEYTAETSLVLHNRENTTAKTLPMEFTIPHRHPSPHFRSKKADSKPIFDFPTRFSHSEKNWPTARPATPRQTKLKNHQRPAMWTLHGSSGAFLDDARDPVYRVNKRDT